MKQNVLFFVILVLLTGIGMQAQVAINTDGSPPLECAILDINAADKGVLFPRVTITSVDNQTPIEGLMQDGLIVYNETEADDIPKGFYFWRDSKWNLLKDGSSTLTIQEQMQIFEAGELYEDNDFLSPSTISMPSSSNYYGWVDAEEGEIFGATSFDTEDLIADRIVIGEDGLYKVEFCISFSGSNNSQVEGAIWVDDVLTASSSRSRIRFLRKLASSGDIGAGSAHGLINLKSNDEIYILFKSNSNGETLNVFNVNFIANKVGEPTD